MTSHPPHPMNPTGTSPPAGPPGRTTRSRPHHLARRLRARSLGVLSPRPRPRLRAATHTLPPDAPHSAPADTASPGRPGPPARPSAYRAADLSASIAVFLIALPLSLGIALATGAPLQAGLVAAAVGGLVVGWFGGAPLQVSGPAAGLTVVVADLIQHYGWRTTCAITVLAGVAQLGLGFLRVARTALVVSPAVVHGMLAGIGVTIALAQLHIVLGGSPQSSVVDNVRQLPQQLADLHPAALSVSALTIAVLLLWPRLPGRPGRLLRLAPGALAAVVLATVVATVTDLRLPRVDLPSWSSHALPEPPDAPTLALIAAVLTVTLVASVESLLSAVAVDKLATARHTARATRSATGDGGPRVPRADLDRELRGQGLGNIVSGSLGGLPVTGVAVRSSANVAAGAVTRRSTMLHGLWVVLAAGLLVGLLELIPLAALAALVMVVGVQMVNLTHIRKVTLHREVLVYAATLLAVVLGGVLEGVAVGIAVAVAVALTRLAHTEITVGRTDDVHRVVVRGELTFLAVPRLSRALARVPEGAAVVLELRGSSMDHAAFDTLQDWQQSHAARGGTVDVVELPAADPGHHRPWRSWTGRDRTEPEATDPAGTADGTGAPHGTTGPQAAERKSPEHTRREAANPETGRTDPERTAPAARTAPGRTLGSPLLTGVRDFQRHTAPLVREELARLARDGQRPTQLFVTCADSRMVTSMITSSGPGDLFTVRNVGNLVPPPGEEHADASVAAAIEYAVDVLRVSSITVCGHSGCGAMQAVAERATDGTEGSQAAPPTSSLGRWLRHAQPTLALLAASGEASAPRIAGRPPADPTETLCLTNVVQQLAHLSAHPCVARRIADGSLELYGMYFQMGEAQAYLLHEDADRTEPADLAGPPPPARKSPGDRRVFHPVRPDFTPVRRSRVPHAAASTEDPCQVPHGLMS